MTGTNNEMNGPRFSVKADLVMRVLLLAMMACTVPAILIADEPEQSELSDLIDRVKQSVVVVTFMGRDGDQLGLGSGFVVGEGLIATNLHVIGEARPIRVRTVDGDEYPVVTVHATDRANDLAILQIEDTDLPVLELGDSEQLKQGQPIIAVGNPLGLEHSVVQGIISGLREDVDGRPMLQLAIPIERGNSGGPVIDQEGRVFGIITLKSQLTDNLGYAVAVNSLKPLLEEPNPIPMSRWLTIGTLNPRQWEAPDDVRWRQRAGRILVDGRGRGFGGRSLCLSQKQIPEGDFEMAVTVKMEEEDGAAGLVFHSDGKDRHYGFYPSSGQLRLSRFDGPDVFSWNVLDEARSPAYHPGDWNRLKVRIDDGLIQCYCNDSLVFESQDSQYTQGRVGLAKFRHTTAAFKGFEVGEEVRSVIPPPEVEAALSTLLETVPVRRPAGVKLINDVLAKAESQTAGAALRAEARRLEEQAVRVRQLADAVHAESVIRELAGLFGNDEQPPDLVHAALLIAALDNDELDVDGYREYVDEMGQELTAVVGDNTDDAAKRQALHRYLFEEQGFHGSRTNYGSASNSYFNEMLDDREGLPITLSVLYLSLAEHIELKAEGIGLPGHFVVRVQEGEDWAIGGRLRSRRRSMSQADAEKTSRFRSPVSQWRGTSTSTAAEFDAGRSSSGCCGISSTSANDAQDVDDCDSAVRSTPLLASGTGQSRRPAGSGPSCATRPIESSRASPTSPGCWSTGTRRRSPCSASANSRRCSKRSNRPNDVELIQESCDTAGWPGLERRQE